MERIEPVARRSRAMASVTPVTPLHRRERHEDDEQPPRREHAETSDEQPPRGGGDHVDVQA